jgi:hypothetical protein
MLEWNSLCISTNLYNSQMNVIFDIFIRFFTSVCNASVQLLQNESFYVIAIVILYIGHRNDNTEHTWYSWYRIQCSQQEIRTFTPSSFACLNQLLLQVQNSHLSFSNCKWTLNIQFWLIQYRIVAFLSTILWISNKIKFRLKT